MRRRANRFERMMLARIPMAVAETLRRALARGFAASLIMSALVVIGSDPSTAQDEGFRPLDRRIDAVLRKWDLPGATVGITRGARLVFAGSYGLADREAAQPMKPETLMRLASVSKVVTAVSVLRLADEGRLDLDANAFALLDLPALPADVTSDRRIAQITVRQLLQHTAGWQFDRSLLQRLIGWLTTSSGGGEDPFLRGGNRQVAKAMKVAVPAGCPTVIDYMRRKSLGFDPGTHFEYANLNYCILGRVIEHVSGQSYVDYIQEHVLKPSGIMRARLGRTLLRERIEGEARYYTPAALTPSALSDSGELVPWPYGGFAIESMDSFGGWVMSSVDVLRLATAMEGRRGKALLSKATLAQMRARPAPPLSQDAPYYYGLGVHVRPLADGGVNWWHGGYLPGTISYVVGSPTGFSAAILVNGSPATDADAKSIAAELEQALFEGAAEIKPWPSEDQFDRFP
jgi:N-acyl-D-amino-acid deacylase